MDEAEAAYRAWKKAFPEMEKHLVGTLDKASGKYYVRTFTGMERMNCEKTETLNTRFQGPASDGAGLALWDAHRSNLFTVGFVHDELIVEIPIETPKQVMQQIELVEDCMVRSMRIIVPDVRIKVESSLQNRWYKEAERVVGDDGCLSVMTGFKPAAEVGKQVPKYQTITELLKQI